MKIPKAVRISFAALAACIACYCFPLFRIRAIQQSDGTKANTNQSGANRGLGGTSVHESANLVESLWKDQLPAAALNAVTVNKVLEMVETDANSARKQFGREVGLGGPTFFILRGSGQIENVDEDQCRVLVDEKGHRVVLEIGILSGNSVRDATGLIHVNDFASSQDFNNLSTELNRLCESAVVEPVRKQLIKGAAVEFVGCCEVRDNDDFKQMKLIPVQLKVLKSGAATE